MRLLPFVVALIGVLALVGWFSWDARRPLGASLRTTRRTADRDDDSTASASPCPTPHWHNPGVDRI